MKTFDYLHCDLQGKHLVEASAGTGKTYTITRIFLRLILEGYKLTEILVVTFTVAATKELKERIRLALQQTLAYLQENKDCSALSEQDIKLLTSYNKERAQSLLQDALSSFDNVSVYTIHSFCKKVLDELPFATASLPGADLITQEENLKSEVVLDFWQRYVQDAPKEFLQFLLELNTGPEEWRQFFYQYQFYPQTPYTLPFHWKKKPFFIQTQNNTNESEIQFNVKPWKEHQEKLIKYIDKCKANFSTLQQSWPKLRSQASSYFTACKEQILGKRSRVDSKIMHLLDRYFENPEFTIFPFDYRRRRTGSS